MISIWCERVEEALNKYKEVLEDIIVIFETRPSLTEEELLDAINDAITTRTKTPSDDPIVYGGPLPPGADV